METDILEADPIERPDFDKNMILSDVPCGHFALSTLSETCFTDAVFGLNVRQQKLAKPPLVNVDIKNKNRIITRYCFVSIDTF